MLGAIFGFLAEPIKEILETRKIKKKAKAESMLELMRAKAATQIARENAKATIAVQKSQHVAQWENLWAAQAATSWKDEFLMVVLITPFICSFIPPLQLHVLNGFEILSMTPEWYRVAIGVVISAVFGLRAVSKFTPKGKQ